jgi:hypothetical protein
MNLTTFVDRLRDEFTLAATFSGPEARELADRLSVSLESSIRLTLMETLSAAADEITRDLAPGSVDVRLRGRDLSFVVTPPSAPEPPVEPAPPSMPVDDGGATTRINLRLPDDLKARIEDAAGREHLSVNAWLVRAAASALNPPGQGSSRRAHLGGERYTGWVR